MNCNKNLKINKTQIIKNIIKEWQKGVVLTASYFNKKRIKINTIDWFISSGWIESVGRGAYKLAGDNVDWFGSVFAIQKQLNFSVHPGDKTALELQGYAHYLKPRMNIVYLFGLRSERLPMWFKNYKWDVDIQYFPTKLFSNNIERSLTNYTHKEFSIKISSPERAAMEMLYLVPKHQGFAEASLIMEKLTTLRPKLVQKLMEHCNSIKVKRLFLYFAEKHNHDWLNQLNTNKIDLGSGKRVIVKNGKLDKKHQITVIPETSI